jgi:hypothetical protein
MYSTYSTFPEGVWDGTCPQYYDLETDKNPDFHMSQRTTSEIQSIEDWLMDRMGVWNTLIPWGPATSFLGVKNDESGLTWRSLVAGPGVTILAPNESTLIISAPSNVPSGGLAGQVLAKATDADFDLTWADSAAGDHTATSTGEAIKAGQPVYVNQADGLIYKASAATDAASQVCGICSVDVASGDTCQISPNGLLSLADWTDATGVAALVIGAVYYLSTVAGHIVTLAPTSGYLVKLAVAITGTRLDINIGPRVRQS